jgi:hypothetical protein
MTMKRSWTRTQTKTTLLASLLATSAAKQPEARSSACCGCPRLSDHLLACSGQGLTARQRSLLAPGEADDFVPRERELLKPRFKGRGPRSVGASPLSELLLQVRALSPKREAKKEKAKAAAREKKRREAHEAQEAAVARVLSGEGSKKKRDAKAQKAQEARP